MKLRIKNNSIRFRLMKSEVEELSKNRHFEGKILFPNMTEMIYSIRSSRNLDENKISFKKNIIEVIVPRSVLDNWATTDAVSIESYIKLPAGKELNVLIEKDFTCLTKREGEDESDAYPNPNKPS